MGSEASKSYTVHEKNRDNSVDMNVNQVALSCRIFQLVVLGPAEGRESSVVCFFFLEVGHTGGMT